MVTFISQSISRSIRRLERETRKIADGDLHFSPEAKVAMDEEMVLRALENSMKNALDYSDDAGTITLTGTESEEDAESIRPRSDSRR